MDHSDQFVAVFALWFAIAIAAYMAASFGRPASVRWLHWSLIGSALSWGFALFTESFHQRLGMQIQSQLSPGFGLEVFRACLALSGFAPLAGAVVGAIGGFALAFVTRCESQRPSVLIRCCAMTGRMAGRLVRRALAIRARQSREP